MALLVQPKDEKLLYVIIFRDRQDPHEFPPSLPYHAG